MNNSTHFRSSICSYFCLL